MKTLLLGFAVGLGLPGLAWSQDAKSLLQQGLFAEEAERKLEKAADNYGQIISAYDDQRTYAVAALYRLAEVRRKQDRNDDAAKLYQRILAEFADADPQARLSKENLAAMGISVEDIDSVIATDPGEEQVLRRLRMLAENSPERVWDEVPLALNDTGSFTTSPLSKAARRGRLRVVSWLLDHAEETKHDIKESMNAALREAALSGKKESCQLLLERGATIDNANGTLVRAIQQNFDDVAEWLIDNGADINAVENGSLPAVDGRAVESTDQYTGIKAQVPVTASYSMSPLAAAIADDDKYWVDRLLELKAEVNVPRVSEYSQDLSALTVACWKGHAPLVRKLLELGADPNAIDSSYQHEIRTPAASGPGWTPLHYGAVNPEIVSALLAAGAEPNAHQEDIGVTPLHVACHFGNLDAVRMLLEAGADANTLGSLQEGNDRRSQLEVTPLMVASFHSNSQQGLSLVDLLITHGADPFTKNTDGADVFQICDIPDTSSRLMERYVYPKLTANESVFIAFPQSGSFFELATAKSETGGADEGISPPSLVDLIANWAPEDLRIRVPYSKYVDKGFRWELLALRRATVTGEYSTTPINIFEERDNPELKWGDIIEIVSNPGTSAPTVSLHSDLPRKLRRPRSRFEIVVVPPAVKFALLGSVSKTITVQFPGDEPREIVTNGGLRVSTPFGSLRESYYETMLFPFSEGRGKKVTKAAVQRDAEHGGDEVSVFNEEGRGNGILPEDGDVVTIISEAPRASRKRRIQLIEPKSRFEIASVEISDGSESPSAGDDQPAMLPTLFQFIAVAYQPMAFYNHFRTHAGTQGRYRTAEENSARNEVMLRRHLMTLYHAFLNDPPASMKPGNSEISEALSAMARSANYRWILLPHPDLTSVSIRRLMDDGVDGPTEMTIEVPVGEFIEGCGANTSPAECRAQDVDLQPGDIVELKAHYDRIDEPWPGFDAATVQFLEKALTYDIRVQPIEGKEIAGTVKWKAPKYYDTKAGLIGAIREDEALLSFETEHVFQRLTSNLVTSRNTPSKGGGDNRWVRQGSFYEEKPRGAKSQIRAMLKKRAHSSSGGSQRRPRRTVILPPSR